MTNPQFCSRRPVRIVALGLSPRAGASLNACQTAIRLLAGRGIEAHLSSTVGLPVIPAGLKEVSTPESVTAIRASVRSADAIILGLPVHRSDIAGIARNWIELLADELVGKPVLPIVAAGSPRAHLVTTRIRTDLWANFNARPTEAVLVTPDLDGEELALRLEAAITSLVASISRTVEVSV